MAMLNVACKVLPSHPRRPGRSAIQKLSRAPRSLLPALQSPINEPPPPISPIRTREEDGPMRSLKSRQMPRHSQTPVRAPKTLGEAIGGPVVHEVGGNVTARLENSYELGDHGLRVFGVGDRVAFRGCDDVRSVFAGGFGAVVVCEC
jgi:hypothetical protein